MARTLHPKEHNHRLENAQRKARLAAADLELPPRCPQRSTVSPPSRWPSTSSSPMRRAAASPASKPSALFLPGIMLRTASATSST